LRHRESAIDSAPFEITTERTHNLTRQGEDGALVDGDDYRFHSIFDMTVNANGVVTVNKFDVREECV
jgi:hypothetical protein